MCWSMKDASAKTAPVSITLPETGDSLTHAELNAKLQHSYEQSLEGKGRPFEEVLFSKRLSPRFPQPHQGLYRQIGDEDRAAG